MASTSTVAQFLYAERMQESGGHYSDVNSSSGALGAYQVMPANVASWTQQALGKVLTAAEFLASPSAQNAVAEKILGGYYAKYGAAGAAAMWYSGQPDPTKTYGDPPVYQYVQDVLAKMGSAPANAGSTGTSAVSTDDATTTSSQPGLQQAGYEAAVNLTPWGIPLNPFKLPGYVAGKLGSAASGAVGSAESSVLDTLGPLVLAALGVATGAVLLTIGAYVTVKPSLDNTASQAAQAVPLAV